MIEQGPVEKSILAECIATNRPLPPQIQNAPEIPLGMELYIVAFQDLDSSRMPAFNGVAPIPWLAINEYAQALGLDDDETEDLHFFIRRLDHFYIKYYRDKS